MRLILKKGFCLFVAAILAVACIIPAAIAEDVQPVLPIQIEESVTPPRIIR